MLSFKKGKPIARIEGGEYDKKIIRLYDPLTQKPCCDKCDKRCKKNKCCDNCKVSTGGCIDCNKGGNDEDIGIKTKNPFDIISEWFFNKKKKKLSIAELVKIEKALIEGKEPEDEELNKIYKFTKDKLDDTGKYEIKLKTGNIIPLPSQDDLESDHIYVAGPSGSGKSTFLGKWIKEIKKIFPKKELIIFSNFTEDEPLDKYKPTRIKMDEEMVKKKPITKEELTNTICVFDDIDTLPKQIASVVQDLRNDLLQCGRKENIKVLCTSHQLMNYKKTRDLLNSCQKIVFFPQATAQYHIRRFLKEYCGMSPTQTLRILKLPSRWILIDKHYPTFCLYETGCLILNKMDEKETKETKEEKIENDE